MKGFIGGTVILVLVIAVVLFTSIYTEVKASRLYSLAERCEVSEDYLVLRDKVNRLAPFLHLVLSDGVTYELDAALEACISRPEDEEKSRLLLAIDEVRRRAGLCPISIL